MSLTVNGKSLDVSTPLTVTALLEHLGIAAQVAVAVRGNVVDRENWHVHLINDGDEVEIVRAVGGGQDSDPFVIGGRSFRSRLFLGTGKYPDSVSMTTSLERSGTEMITVAIRYMDFEQEGGGDILRHLDLKRCQLLPNTAGAYTVEQAVRMSRLARAATGTNWIKLEVIGDQDTLLPDLAGTIAATKILVAEGFVVLPYCTSDLVTCLRLEAAGAAAVMPLASLIGSGQGLVDWVALRRVVERVQVPVVVDAGLGVPSDAAMAMELGATAVLINTAIAKAQDPPLMAEAMRLGVEAGRKAYLSGRMPKLASASASSPTAGVPAATGVRRQGEVE